jgi:hypothetical protein
MNDGAEPTYEVLCHRLGQLQGAAAACGRAGSILNRLLPDPVRRPPDNPPPEPIIIKVPPRPPEAPEVDRPDDEDEAEIKTPLIVPEMPPPPRPEERPFAAPSLCARGGPAR